MYTLEYLLSDNVLLYGHLLYDHYVVNVTMSESYYEST